MCLSVFFANSEQKGGFLHLGCRQYCLGGEKTEGLSFPWAASSVCVRRFLNIVSSVFVRLWSKCIHKAVRH